MPGDATIVVTSEDESMQKTYTIHFTVKSASTKGLLAEYVKAYTNPVSDILYINAPSGETLQATIYSISGSKTLQTKLSGKGTVDVSSLSRGIYLLKIKNTEGVLNMTIIKE